jgi:hypothetical protein
MAVLDTGSSTAGKANVTADYELAVALQRTAAKSGFAVASSEVDAGSVSGSRVVRAGLTSANRRLLAATDQVIFDDSFSSTSQNTTLWRSAVTTFTLGLASGYVVFNNSLVTTTTSSQVYQTWRTFTLVGQQVIATQIRAMITAAPPSNWVANFGFAAANVASAPYTPSDGAYFRINSMGIYGVVNYNGTETVSGLLLAAAAIPVNTNIGFRVLVTQFSTEFWYQGGSGDYILLGTISTPAGNGQPYSAGSVPVTLQLTQPGVASAAVSIKFSDVTVWTGDNFANKPYNHVAALQGQHSSQGQNGGTLGTTALYSNSLAAGAGAALTNTTAAAGSGLGGQFSVQPTLAAGTDGVLTSYQNPAGSATAPPRNLVITGLRLQGTVTTALTGGPCIFAISLAYGHTAVSLATAEAINAKAPRRVPLGIDAAYVATAAVGVTGTALDFKFSTPIVVNPGEFIQVVLKNLGTVTSAGVITYLVGFEGYWD